MKENTGEKPKFKPKRTTPVSKKGRKQRKVKARTPQQYLNGITTETSQIKNKQKRLEVRQKRRLQLKALKSKARKSRQSLPAQERQKPITIEDKQTATDGHMIMEHPEHDVDEFADILNNNEQVKVMITSSEKPTKRLYDFIKELMVLFPRIYYYPRQSFPLEDVYKFAKNMGYSHVLVVRDAGRWELMVRKIDGCMAIFKITNITLAKNIFHKGVATDHRPELILNNFNSKMGVKVGRLLSSLFPQDPQFRGRRVVTFHNQRDFIFVRHHRYIFKDEFTGVSMQEIGPRFTLRLTKLYQVGEDNAVGDLEFQTRDDMYVERTKILL